jgi:hypothetical protein
MTERHTAANGAPQRTVHEPRCNTNCSPGWHYLTSGIGFPHIHRTDLGGECGACVIQPGSTDYLEQP